MNGLINDKIKLRLWDKNVMKTIDAVIVRADLCIPGQCQNINCVIREFYENKNKKRISLFKKMNFFDRF